MSNDMTCLHIASHKNMSPDSLRSLIAAFDEEDHFKKVMSMKNKVGSSKKWNGNETPIDLAKDEVTKSILSDPEIWKKCRSK